MKKKLNYLIIAVIGLITLYGLTACGLQPLVYPGATMHMPDSDYGCEAERVEFKAQDGTALRGWFFNRGPNTPLVAFYGGNAMNVGGFTDIAKADSSRSYLLINYRGYGNSEGEPSESAIVKDSCHALSLASEKLGKPVSVTLVGFSLGSGVATQVAAAVKPDALILICPFDSITEVACNYVPFVPRLVPLDSWRSVDYAPGISCRVAILRALKDSIVPPYSTDSLIRAFSATTPAVFEFDCDHNQIFSAPQFTETLKQQLP